MELHYTDTACLFWIGEDLFAENHIGKMIEVWGVLCPGLNFEEWRTGGAKIEALGVGNEDVLAPVCGEDFVQRRIKYETFIENGGGFSPKYFCLYFSRQFWGNELVLTPVELDAMSHAGYKVVLDTYNMIVVKF